MSEKRIGIIMHGVTGRAAHSGARPAHLPFLPCMMMPMRFSLM